MYMGFVSYFSGLLHMYDLFECSSLLSTGGHSINMVEAVLRVKTYKPQIYDP